ncbi:maleylpyruvate isomerase family mycothiol-dependent enzyme [Mycobacterium sp. Marseille-P9652]|uniref:maleylpyruvate isomerase family mycothiol-dependent enzyme n=1 Tax=Mycobacterium sp. Marseille-P9652 TaxID=2654950 RepID=UPI0012E74C06|nr:maleylpyruvate isomerase family mycothiol-dependent enzyme [Mycobacterium sp. Marseille-P9652]
MTATSAVRPGPDRDQTMAGLLNQYGSFAELIGALDALEWTRRTRCAGWQVRDVAGHVVGQAMDVVGGTIGSRTPDDQAAALRGESPTALAASLRSAMDSVSGLMTVFDDALWSAPSPAPGLTIGQGMHALLQDAYVHGDDIRAALGLPFDPGPGLHASLDFVLGALLRDETAAAEPAIAKLLTVPAEGFGERTGMAPHDLLLAATGRSDPARLRLPDTINIFR